MTGAAPAAGIGRSRAARPGSGRVRSLVIRATVAAAAGAVALTGCGGGHTSYSASGFHPTYPSFLPKKTVGAPTDVTLTGTSAKPALTVQGDSVEVKTPTWSVLAEVSGPVVPGEGLPNVTPATTCTWTLTFSHATGSVPLSTADFNSVDHLGTIYHLNLVPGQPVPPATLKPGQKVTFELRSYEETGEGIMRWAPIDQKIVAMWDYEVEND